MNDEKQKDLKATGASPPAGPADEKSRTSRKPSESKRLVAGLRACRAAGIEPTSIHLTRDGDCVIHLGGLPGGNGEEDEVGAWLERNLLAS